MVSKRKIGKIAALVSVPLLAAASYLSLSHNKRTEEKPIAAETRPQSLPANDLYATNREIKKEKDFQNWLNAKENGSETRAHTPCLEETIEHLGYRHLRSNVGSLSGAQLICLGEIHRLCGNEEDFILSDEFVGEYDKIVVEETPPFTLN